MYIYKYIHILYRNIHLLHILYIIDTHTKIYYRLYIFRVRIYVSYMQHARIADCQICARTQKFPI